MSIKGRPMISHMVDRLRLIKRSDQIVLCTSPVEEDTPLAEFADSENIPCFRGDPDDVLQRLTDAAEIYQADWVINCTADNPLIDPIYLDRLASFMIDNEYDYADTSGLPWGAYGWSIAYPAMVEACGMKDERDTEVWGKYFTGTGKFKWGTLKADENVCWPDLRLTVDTPEDFQLMTSIFEELYRPGEVFSLVDVVELCRRRPDLVAINSHIQQKTPKPIKLKDQT